MMQRRAIVLLLGLSLLGACDREADTERLQALERRITALEARGSEAVEPAATSVDADVRSLERRVAALEGQIHDLAQARAGGAGAAPGSLPGAPALSGRRERRMQLRELTAQYRERLATIRRDEPDPAKRQEAVREALEWYREQRSQLLAEPLPPTP